KEIQKAIRDSLKLEPIEQEVIVLYEGEKENLRDDFWKKQRIVEVPKKRPEWFNPNLLQPTIEESPELENKKPEDDLRPPKQTEGN
ncbi:39S ribosomal protein L32, mitochondrial-like, partial [Ceratina calcarata]|uniref:39S ribosomal protein L32, mitochondrial-like n=1 Tax=Ceratina calcarata TaxID=156304 RepID=A0AAJ7IUZ3_9HYME